MKTGLTALILGCAVALTGCGSGGGDKGDKPASTPLTQADRAKAADLAAKDGKAVGEALKAAYLKDGKFPATADGLVKLGADNALKNYKVVSGDAPHAQFCVEHSHEVDGVMKPVGAMSEYVRVDKLPSGTTVRVDPMGRTEGMGC